MKTALLVSKAPPFSFLAQSFNPFELIPLVTATARLLDSEHTDDETMTNEAITHADDLNAWLYGLKAGSIKETRYQINPDDSEINSFCKERHAQCIKGVAGASVSFNNNSVISQLTNAISTQNEEAIKFNRLRHQEIERIINKDESKKDRTKKFSHLDHQDDWMSISKKLNRQIRGSLGMVHPFHQFGKFWNGSVQAHPSI